MNIMKEKMDLLVAAGESEDFLLIFAHGGGCYGHAAETSYMH
jgi:hypothetical protein